MCVWFNLCFKIGLDLGVVLQYDMFAFSVVVSVIFVYEVDYVYLVDVVVLVIETCVECQLDVVGYVKIHEYVGN